MKIEFNVENLNDVVMEELRSNLKYTLTTSDSWAFKHKLQEAVSDQLGSLLKRQEYSDPIERAVKKYITKDIAEKIIEMGVEAYLDKRGR